MKVIQKAYQVFNSLPTRPHRHRSNLMGSLGQPDQTLDRFKEKHLIKYSYITEKHLFKIEKKRY